MAFHTTKASIYKIRFVKFNEKLCIHQICLNTVFVYKTLKSRKVSFGLISNKDQMLILNDLISLYLYNQQTIEIC